MIVINKEKTNFKIGLLQKKSKEVFNEAMTKFGMRLFKIMSRRRPMPPIKTGLLRGTHVLYLQGKLLKGKKFVKRSPNNLRLKGRDRRNIIEVAQTYNTKYARRMYYHDGNWGERSIRDGRVENNAIMKSYKAIGPILFKKIIVKRVARLLK